MTQAVAVQQLARAAGGAAWHVLAHLLIAVGRTPLARARAQASYDQALARWRPLIAAMADLEALTPASANDGWLADAEFTDAAAPILARQPPRDLAARIRDAAGWLAELTDALATAADLATPRADIRRQLERAFEAWAKACRAMAALEQHPPPQAREVA